MPHEVDKHIKGIYLDILRKMLEKPEEWLDKNEWNDHSYRSPYISKEDKVAFITVSSILTFSRCKSIYVYKDIDQIYEFIIPWTEFKIRRLLNNLYIYKECEIEMKKIQKVNNLLTESLGKKMERYIKLTKIRKKL